MFDARRNSCRWARLGSRSCEVAFAHRCSSCSVAALCRARLHDATTSEQHREERTFFAIWAQELVRVRPHELARTLDEAQQPRPRAKRAKQAKRHGKLPSCALRAYRTSSVALHAAFHEKTGVESSKRQDSKALSGVALSDPPSPARPPMSAGIVVHQLSILPSGAENSPFVAGFRTYATKTQTKNGRARPQNSDESQLVLRAWYISCHASGIIQMQAARFNYFKIRFSDLMI